MNVNNTTNSAPENQPQPSIEELEREFAAAEKRLIEARANERKKAIQEILAKMAQNNITVADLETASAKRSSSAGIKIPPKYRDPQTGETWTGRGRAPVWLKGRDKNDFLIKSS